MSLSKDNRFDAIIVGGGPSGLSAALVLGRCRRKTLIYDAGHPRNERSNAMHGFLSRDGMPPGEFAAVSRQQLEAYPDVQLRHAEVVGVSREEGGFVATLKDGSNERSRLLLLATGLVDEFPDIEGFHQFYGKTIHHCPYCDGWEHRDQPLGVFGGKVEGAELAEEMYLWSRDLILFTNGEREYEAEHRDTLERLGIRVVEDQVKAFEGEGEKLRGVRLRSGEFIPREAVFFSPGQYQRSPLAKQIGCAFAEDGGVKCDDNTATDIPGVYAVGNATCGLQLVIIAAAEGTQAAFAMNEELSKRDLENVCGRSTPS